VAKKLGFVFVPCGVYPHMSAAEIQTRRFMVNSTARDWTKAEHNREIKRLKEQGIAVDSEIGLR
jgi:hypothetical protein